MQKISIQMTERHIAFCYDLIKNEPVDTYLTTATNIKNAIKANTDPAALLSVEVEVPILETIYHKAGLLTEGYATVINDELKTALIPQLQTYAQQEADAKTQADADAAQTGQPAVAVDMSVTKLLDTFQNITDYNKGVLDQTIAEMLTRLKA